MNKTVIKLLNRIQNVNFKMEFVKQITTYITIFVEY